MRKMKNLLLSLLTVMAVSMGMMSCSHTSDEEDDPDWIFDYSPIEFFFQLVDDAGNNLIDMDGPLYGQDFSVLYNGEEYKVNWESTKTRYYMPIFYGLEYKIYENDWGAILYFGEFDGAGSEENFTLVLPNGEKHNVHIYRRAEVKKNKSYIYQTITLDGVEQKEYTNGIPYILLRIVTNP